MAEQTEAERRAAEEHGWKRQQHAWWKISRWQPWAALLVSVVGIALANFVWFRPQTQVRVSLETTQLEHGLQPQVRSPIVKCGPTIEYHDKGWRWGCLVSTDCELTAFVEFEDGTRDEDTTSSAKSSRSSANSRKTSGYSVTCERVP